MGVGPLIGRRQEGTITPPAPTARYCSDTGPQLFPLWPWEVDPATRNLFCSVLGCVLPPQEMKAGRDLPLGQLKFSCSFLLCP